MKTAFILGATGLVGSKVIRQLLENQNFSKITAIGRRLLPTEDLPNKEKLEQKVVDFDKLDEYKDAFNGHDCGFICLGTTRADAGSAKAFYKIDHDYIVHSAKLYKESSEPTPSQKKHVLLLTSTGSNANSFFLYPKTKGENERDIRQLGFDHVSIFRPGLLILDPQDQRSRKRMGEAMAISVSGWLGHPKTFSIRAHDVAAAMIKIAQQDLQETSSSNDESSKSKIYEHSDLFI